MDDDDRTTETSTERASADHAHIHRYEIRVEGQLGQRWATWFDGMALADADDGTTVISGPVIDQAALHGLLQKLRDLGVTLVSLTELPPDAPRRGPTARHHEREPTMTTHTHIQATPSTSHERRLTLAAGLLYIATFVFSIPAAFGLYDDVLDHAAAFALGQGSTTPVLWGAFFEVITALTCIGTAVALYPVIRRHGPAGAIGFVASRTLEASMIFLGIVNVLAIVTLRDTVGGGNTEAVRTAAESMLAMKDWTFLLGPGFMAAVNALCLAPILYRAHLVPRIIPTLGLVGAPLLFASSTATLFGLHDQDAPSAMLLVLPIFVWELAVGVWMTFKGFRPSPVDDAQPTEVAPALAGALT